MPEEIKSGEDALKTSPSTTGGTDPNKTGPGASGSGFDPSTVKDEEFGKVFEDPRIWNHPRFKSLNERANVAKQLEEEKKVNEEKRLTDEKKFQELAQLKEQEANTWKSKAENATINTSIISEATKAGAIKVEAVTKLIDKSGIKLGEDGTVTGVAEAVKALVESDPYLFGKGGNNASLGSGTNPGNGNAQTPTFKLSQLQDHKFFMDHQKEIDQAYKLGLIINDTGAKA